MTSNNRVGMLATGVSISYLATTALLHRTTADLAAVVRAPGPAPLDAAFGVAAAAAAWLVLTWLALAMLLTLAAAAQAGTRPASHRLHRLDRLAGRITPALVRRVAAAALGAGLAGGSMAGGLPAYAEGTARPGAAATARPSTPATAATAATGAAATGAATAVPTLDRPSDPLPGWTPDRPAPRPTAHAPSRVHLVSNAPLAGRAVADEVVVRRGDTLWDIAARHLGPDATAAEVASEWPRWHRANSDVIGPEPDRILPGQRLRPPAAANNRPR